MRKLNRLAALIVGLFLIATATAVPVNYETTSVSRIIGETPDAMRLQLMKQDFTLDTAGLYTDSFETETDVKEILKSQFGTVSVKNPLSPTWTTNDVGDQLANNKRNLVVMNSNVWEGTPYQMFQGKVKDVKNWNFQKNNLLIFDSYAAGLHLKQTETFASTLTPKATVIAPLSHTSANFVKALVCNLGKHSTIGEVFKQARNNYYAHTHQRSEFLGLTMLSYALSGIPTRKITNVNWDTSKRTKYCSDYNEVFGASEASEYSIQEDGDSFVKEVTVNFGEPTVTDTEGFSLIVSESTQQQFTEDSLVTPSRTEITDFPLKTAISKIELVGFDDPVDMTVNLPDWNGSALKERTCYQQAAPQTAEFASTQTEEAVTVITHLNPLETVNCEEGQFRFYKKAAYKITYIPYSPLRITSIEHPDVMVPGQTTDIIVHVENTETSPATGKLALSNADGVISTLDITATQSAYDLELTAPAEEGLYSYAVDFMRDEDTKTTATFDQPVDILETGLDVPDISSSSAEVTLTLTNNLQESLPVTVEYELSADGEYLDSSTQTLTLPSGTTTTILEFDDLDKETGIYDLTINIPYLESNEMLTGVIVTNRAPVIEQADVLLKEGDAITVTPEFSDPDGDALITSIDSDFPLDGSHAFSFDESGTYLIMLHASDGILSTEKTVYVVVENVNRAPSLSVPESVAGKEGKLLKVEATAADPDNENEADNDDNTLTIAYGWPLDENGEFVPSFEFSGIIEVPVTVNDGELMDTKTVKLEIANTNRAPTLDVGDITIKEGESIDLWKGSDPDNENEVSDDDNALQFYFGGGPDGGPIDHFGRWQTDYEDSGVYPITVQVEDGELKTGKAITVTVLNVNRPPVISAPDVVYASGSVDLSRYVTDPDNTNSVATDDNTLTVTYTSPFDENGKWTPSQPDSAAQVTITVSDGESTVSKTIMVMVDVVGVQSVQSPPVPAEEPETENQEPESTTETNDQSPPANSPSANSQPAAPSPSQESIPAQTTQEMTPAPEQQATTSQQALTQTTLQEQQTSSQAITQQTTPTPGTLEIKIVVDGEEVQDGDSVKVKPDDEFTVKVDLENNAGVENDVDVSAELADFDQEDEDIVTLEPGESERMTFEFEIPRLTDDDEYPLEINVNENKYEMTLKIDKPSHAINIRSLTIDPKVVPCEQATAKLGIKIENAGKYDEEGIVKIQSDALKLADEWPFDLPEGETQRLEKTISALVPGSHNIIVTALYGSKKAQAEKTLAVEACVQEGKVSTQIAPEERIALALSNKQVAVPVHTDAGFSETITIVFVVLTTLFAVLLLAVFIPPLFK
jgi:uncharacterized cupredoxin-like copper-binding protein